MDNKPQWSRRSSNDAEVAQGMTKYIVLFDRSLKAGGSNAT
jgi:hypothetical protein